MICGGKSASESGMAFRPRPCVALDVAKQPPGWGHRDWRSRLPITTHVERGCHGNPAVTGGHNNTWLPWYPTGLGWWFPPSFVLRLREVCKFSPYAVFKTSTSCKGSATIEERATYNWMSVENRSFCTPRWD